MLSRSPLALALALAALALCARPCVTQVVEESEPRLILAGSHTVQPGQVVALQWTAADAVSELEILLSLDGGRTYPIWVSPRLDPKVHRFVWRVPSYAGCTLSMRIRFHRGGREIEGAPTHSIVVARGEAEPLGLPPLAAGPERAPRPNGGDESRSWRVDGSCEAASHLAPPRRIARRPIPPPTSAKPETGATALWRPCFVPLRA